MHTAHGKNLKSAESFSSLILKEMSFKSSVTLWKIEKLEKEKNLSSSRHSRLEHFGLASSSFHISGVLV